MNEGVDLLEPWLSTAPQTWWRLFSGRLTTLTTTAVTVLEADCRYILERGVLGAGEPRDRAWPASRVRKGVVMGAVQSGKTASMLGVLAMAMDAKVDVIVVLAGTRLSL